MSLFSLPKVWLLSLIVGVPLSNAQGLRLVSNDTGDPETTWAVEGDLIENADLVHASPSYSMMLTPVDVVEEQRVRLLWSIVSVERTAPWSQSEVEDALVVFLWLNAGRVEWIEVKAAQPLLHASGSFPADAVRWSSEGRAMAGSPVVLLYKNGAFIAPRPWFEAGVHQRVLVKIAAGVTDGLEDDLRALRNLELGAARGKGFTLMHVAAESGNIPALQALLEAGADINAESFGQRTALHWAAANGQTEAVAWLLDHGAKHSGDRERVFPLQAAIRAGHMACAAEIYERLDSRFFRKEMLGAAARHGDRALSRKLLDEYRDWQVKWIDEEPVWQVLWSQDAELLQRMLDRGMSPHRRPYDVPMLNVAVRAGDEAMVRVLLAAGSKLEMADVEGRTPLIEAVRNEEETMVALLLDAGAKVTNRDHSKRTPLDYARERGVTGIAALLQAERATIHARAGRATVVPAGRIHAAHEVDESPRLVARPAFALSYGASVSTNSEYSGILVRNDSGDVTDVLPGQSLSSSIASTERTDHQVIWTGIVEPDGTVSEVLELRTSPQDFFRNFDERVSDYRFAPGTRNGEPVRTRIVWLEDFRD